MRDDRHELPTPRSTLRTGYVRVLLTCRHQRDADPQALIDAGRGIILDQHGSIEDQQAALVIDGPRRNLSRKLCPSRIVAASSPIEQRTPVAVRPPTVSERSR